MSPRAALGSATAANPPLSSRSCCHRPALWPPGPLKLRRAQRANMQQCLDLIARPSEQRERYLVPAARGRSRPLASRLPMHLPPFCSVLPNPADFLSSPTFLGKTDGGLLVPIPWPPSGFITGAEGGGPFHDLPWRLRAGGMPGQTMGCSWVDRPNNPRLFSGSRLIPRRQPNNPGPLSRAATPK